MNNKITNDLHFFEDIHISKSQTAARIIYLFFSFLNSAKRYRLLFTSFATSAVITAFAAAKFICLLNGKFSFTGVFILSLGITFPLFIYTSLLIGRTISYKVCSKLEVGIRDSWFIMAAFNLYFIFLLPPAGGNYFYKFFFLTLLVGIAFLLLSFYYEKRIVVKKQPDLDIPKLLDGDTPVDFTVSKSISLKKIQIKGDTRDAVVLASDEDVKLKLRGKPEKIKFAVAVNESSKIRSLSEMKIKVFVETDDHRDTLVYSKLLDSKLDEKSTSWIEVSLDMAHLKLKENCDMTVRLEPVTGRVVGGGRSCSFSAPRITASSNPRKVIFVVMDAVRADHIGCYGYPRPITPNIDNFSKDCVSFKSAMGQGDWTLSAFMSLLTGMYPSSHHVYHQDHYHTLDKDIPTLAGVLRKNGFITRSYFTHKRVMSHFGFAKGFDSHLFRQCNKSWNIATADDVTDRVIDMMEFHDEDDLFLMFHYFDTHQPCDPPSPFSEMYDKTYGKKTYKDLRQELMKKSGIVLEERDLENFIAKYDTEIFRLDMKIQFIIDYLKRKGHYEEAMIIITADHGMLLNDHGSLTKITLFDETVKVPLMIKFPKSSNLPDDIWINDRVVEASIDIMPTVLDTYGIKIPETVQGRSVLPLVCETHGPISKTKGYAVSESLFNDSYIVSVRDNKYRYTFKTDFDISDFKNYKDTNLEEEIYRSNNISPEVELSKSEKSDLIKRYGAIVRSHIDNTCKSHTDKGRII